MECRDKIAGSKEGCGKMGGAGANCSNYVKIIVSLLDFEFPTLDGLSPFNGPSTCVSSQQGRAQFRPDAQTVTTIYLLKKFKEF